MESTNRERAGAVTSASAVLLFLRLFVRQLVRVWSSKSLWRGSRVRLDHSRSSSRARCFGSNKPPLRAERAALQWNIEEFISTGMGDRFPKELGTLSLPRILQ